MSFAAVLILLTCLPTALIDFALPKWKADKNVRIEDAYKWTYQATRGGEHAVPDEESARRWLDDEWASLGAWAANEPLWETLCPGGEIGRLNLRQYKMSGRKVDDLLNAFLTSSRDYRSDASSFISAWTELGKRLKKSSVGKLTHRSWAKLDVVMKAKDYPAIHHSQAYQKARLPAYRILTKAEMQRLLAKSKRRSPRRARSSDGLPIAPASNNILK